MKFVNSRYNVYIDLEENSVYELVIEHRDSFFKIVYMLSDQIQGNIGDFILSEDKELKFDKYVDIITDYYSLTLNNRKIIGRLYSDLQKIADDHVIEKATINSNIISFFEELIISSGYSEVIYDLDYSWSNLFKLYNIGFEESYDSLTDKLICYIKVLSKLTEVKVLLLVNIRAYLSQSELEKIYEICSYCKLHLFLIEPVESMDRSSEIRYIIDKDLCFISANS